MNHAAGRTLRGALVLLLAAALPPAWADLSRGLVAHYPLDGSADDASGNGQNGVLQGGVAPAADRHGHSNGALQFNGVDGYVVAAADLLPAGTRTVSLWFRADALANRPVLLGYGGSSCGTSWFEGLNAAPPVYQDSYYLSSHCDVNNLIKPYEPGAVLGRWVHLVIGTSPRGTVMYVNGVKVASNATFVQQTPVQGRDLAIGVNVSPWGYAPYTDGNIGYFQGAIDDVRIYNRLLSRSEIRELYRGSE